jgi:hypothetical protein
MCRSAAFSACSPERNQRPPEDTPHEHFHRAEPDPDSTIAMMWRSPGSGSTSQQLHRCSVDRNQFRDGIDARTLLTCRSRGLAIPSCSWSRRR